jgi:hypothetical protein
VSKDRVRSQGGRIYSAVESLSDQRFSPVFRICPVKCYTSSTPYPFICHQQAHTIGPLADEVSSDSVLLYPKSDKIKETHSLAPPSNSFYEKTKLITRLVNEFTASLKPYSSTLSSQKQLLYVTLNELNTVHISTPYVLRITSLLPWQINLITSIPSAPKPGRARVRSLGFFFDLILPAALWPRGRLDL